MIELLLRLDFTKKKMLKLLLAKIIIHFMHICIICYLSCYYPLQYYELAVTYCMSVALSKY